MRNKLRITARDVRTTCRAIELRSLVRGWLPLVGVLAAAPVSGQSTVAFTGVNVVDVSGGTVLADRTVVVSGNRIAAVGPGGSVVVPAGADVIDAGGRYLIPGLWDMHVHVAVDAARDLPVFLALGVTGVRNMHTSVDTSLELTESVKRRLASGDITGPRFIANGGIVDGPWPIYDGSVAIASPDAGRRAVDSLVAGGADFIKVYVRLPRDAYFAIADQARLRDVPFVGHVPVSVRVTEAAEAGQRSIEHTDALNPACSADRDSIHARLANPDAPPFRGYPDVMRAYLRNWSPDRCRDVIRKLGTTPDLWFVPTMSVYRAPGRPDSIMMDEAAVSALPQSVWQRWRAQAAQLPDDLQSVDASLFDAALVVVRELKLASVPLLAGTDYGNPFLSPGYSLHDELELLVAAGLSPLEALRAATLEPARFLEAIDSLGTIEAGKLADLVLLDANPLAEIGNTRRIRAVIANGRFFDRTALDSLLGGKAEARIRPDTAGNR